MTREEAIAVLESGNFEAFLGVGEDLEVEFKGEPYQLDQDVEKFELAKDCSALANASGGVIVIGVRTKRHAESPADVGHEIRCLSRGLVDEVRYLDVIGERVYPRVEGVHVRFFEGRGEEGRGLVSIDVPPQEERQKYFLVQRPIGGEGRIPGWVFGIAIRSLGRVDEQRIGEVHSLINKGLTVSVRLESLEASVAQLHVVRESDSGPAVESPADRVSAVLDQWVEEFD